MRIDFFEEFPDSKSLNKLKLINFRSTLYIAAKSFKEFERIKSKIKKLNFKIEAAYWPILEKSYWISPFSYSKELKNLYEDLLKNKQNKPLKLLLDLELPFLNKKLIFLNLFHFFHNKKLIRKIFIEVKKINFDVRTAEYPFLNKKMLELLGISYSFKDCPHKKIIMFYSSVIKGRLLQEKLKQSINNKHKKLKEKLQAGAGLIAQGIFGNETILSPKELDSDLQYFKEIGIKNVVIYRIRGLNKEYIKVIRKHT